jgi:hypothetical protein
METQTNQAPELKRKVVKSKAKQTAEPVVATEPVESAETAVEEQSNSYIIPSSRIKNYISKEHLNKELDSIIDTLKKSEAPVDLTTLLNEEMQNKVGAVIKQKEEKGEEIKLNALVVDLLSKQKYKFSHNSFMVLSVFLDMLVEDLTISVMDEVIKNKKSIINVKYLFSAVKDSPLFDVYSSLPTYKAEQELVNKQSSEQPSEQPEAEPEVETQEEPQQQSSINFEFYIRKICQKLKLGKEEYKNIKVSNHYQKFCSNIILEFLDRVIPMTKIVLDVMTTKTITNVVFKTILRLNLYQNPHCDEIMQKIDERLNH